MILDRALGWLTAAEGGESNEKDDHGGLTVAGVTQLEYTAWRGKKGLPDRPVTEMTVLEWRQLYTEDYWLEGSCHKLPPSVALVHFDTCVNSGPPEAIKLLQDAVGQTKDGVMGPRTIAAASQGGVVEALLSVRDEFYEDIVRRDPTQARFLPGWQQRLTDLRRFVAAFTGA